MHRIFASRSGRLPRLPRLVNIGVALQVALLPAAGESATLSITSHLSQVEGEHPNPGRSPAGAEFHDGDLAHFVWTFDPDTLPVRQFVLGELRESYVGGTAQILALDGSVLHDLGPFTALNLTASQSLALVSAAGDGVFSTFDQDFVPVSGMPLAQIVAPLLVNGNARSSDYFIRKEDGTVWRFWATSGDFAQDLPLTAPVPLPAPGILLAGLLAGLGLLRRVRWLA